jgi:hypothetical protein
MDGRDLLAQRNTDPTDLGVRYHLGGVGSTVNNGSFSANVLYSAPYPVLDAQSVGQIACYIVGTGTATLLRMGIYTTDLSTLRPLTKVVDAGDLAANVTGVRKQVLSPPSALTANTLYWLVVLLNGTATMLSIHSNYFPLPIIGHDSQQGTLWAGMLASQSYGALPTTYPSSTPTPGWIPAVGVLFT